MTRAEKVAEARRLRAEGLSVREIAARMGSKRSTVSVWLTDPDLSKQRARRRRYQGTCKECGATTDGSNGKDAAPDICRPCRLVVNADRNARIFEAWERGETGQAIAAREDMSSGAVLTLVDAYRRLYGRPLQLHRRRNRELWPLIERRWREGATGREIAAECGTTQENVWVMVQAMRDAGVDLPYHLPPRKVAA